MEYKEIIKKIITRIAFGGAALFSFSTCFLLFFDIYVHGYSTIRSMTWWYLSVLLFFLFMTNIILYLDFYYKSR